MMVLGGSIKLIEAVMKFEADRLAAQEERDYEMKTKETHDASSSTQLKDKFMIQWPDELGSIKPKHIIDVTPTRQAYIYEETRRTYPRDGVGQPYDIAGYYVRFVMKKTGMLPLNEINGYYGDDRNGMFRENLRAVRHLIEEYSAQNQPKTKTITQKVKVEVNGDDAEDD